MNNPYYDNKLFHAGWQIGLVFPSLGITEANDTVHFKDVDHNAQVVSDTLHTRVSSPGYGIRIGGIFDLRLCKYLNLRCTPGFEWLTRTIEYKSASGKYSIAGTTKKNFVDVASFSVDIPLFLKFSAERAANFRPYVIAGGGVSFNINYDKKAYILLDKMDAFCQVGFGCDLYFRWFKLCPELTYRIGFLNQLAPLSAHITNNKNTEADLRTISEVRPYVNSIDRMINQSICLTFNFE